MAKLPFSNRVFSSLFFSSHLSLRFRPVRRHRTTAPHGAGCRSCASVPLPVTFGRAGPKAVVVAQRTAASSTTLGRYYADRKHLTGDPASAFRTAVALVIAPV